MNITPQVTGHNKMTTTHTALIGRASVPDLARLAHGHRDDDDDDQQMPLI